MRRERTDYERLSDSVVLLAPWAQAQERMGGEVIGDRLKLMKLAFLAAYPLYWDRVKALNLTFQRYTWGPYTGQVSDNWADLEARGLLDEAELFTVTEEGMRFARAFTKDVLSLEENSAVYQTVAHVADQYAALDTDELLKQVYSMWCFTVDSPGKKHEVEKVAQGRLFTQILEEEDAEEQLVIPPGWQVTLDLTFDPLALRNLNRGIEDTHAGRLYGWEALGSGRALTTVGTVI